MVGGESGVIDGGTIGQILGGQIGAMSRELEQIASTLPFTHSQLQSAFAFEAMRKETITAVTT
jgi:hypothetical protein